MRHRRGVPPWVVVCLLLLCLFAPYGTFAAGGGTLRIDHLAVYAVAAATIALYRPQMPALGWAHLAVLAISLLATVAHLDFVEGDPLGAVKGTDNLIRAALVMMVAASARAPEDRAPSPLRCLGPISIALAVFAVIDRFAADTSVGKALTELYGGPVYPHLGVNHKGACLALGRATGPFVTAPSLAMAAVVILLVALAAPETFGRWRIPAIACALVAGALSNSKSFVLGAPLAVLTMATGRRMAAVAGAGAVVLAGLACAPTDVAWNPLAGFDLADDRLDLLTAGRVTRDESILWVSGRVMEASPAVGYGVGQAPGLPYADSAVNLYMLRAGILGLAAAVAGFALQFWRFWTAQENRWRALGWRAVLMAVAFLAAGPVLQMPRISDLFAVVVGLCAAGISAEGDGSWARS